MKLISVNVRLLYEAPSKGKTVSIGIFKAPVTKRVMVPSLDLDCDGSSAIIEVSE